MPTIFSHAAVPLAIGFACGPTRIVRPVFITGIALSMLPDLDVVSFLMGIDYADSFGHRGASHSLFAAAMIGGLTIAWLKPERWRLVFAFLFASMASHGLLDTLTNGGLGAALYWPFSNERIFAPVTPIAVSPIAHEFFSMRAFSVLLSEMIWIWSPAIIFALSMRAFFRRSAKVE